MAVKIPTLSELYTDILADLEAETGVTIPLFGKVFLRALAVVQAAKMKLYYLQLAKVQKNIFVDTADPMSMGGTLERFGLVKLNRLPFGATAGSYEVEVTGEIGATIKVGTTFKSVNSRLYILDAEYILTATTDTITLRALDVGLDARLNIGDELTATAPIADVDSLGIVTDELVVPIAPESMEDYRAKAIEAYRLEPQGGAGSDYRLWSYDAVGVKQTYPYARQGYPNEVIVYVEAPIISSTDGFGTPSQTVLDNVAEVIEFDPDLSKPLYERGRRPLGVFNVAVRPIEVVNVDIEVYGYVGLNNDKKTLMDNALTEFVNSVRPFVSSVDVLSEKNDIISDNNITFTILGAVPQSIFAQINLRIDGVLVPSHNFLLGQIPNLNSITYA